MESKVPVLTPEERAAALEVAKATRKGRAEIRKQIADGKLTMQQLYDRRDEKAIGSMRVALALKSFPGIGSAKSEKIMSELGIAPNRCVKGLGSRQLQGLIEATAETTSEKSK